MQTALRLDPDPDRGARRPGPQPGRPGPNAGGRRRVAAGGAGLAAVRRRAVQPRHGPAPSGPHPGRRRANFRTALRLQPQVRGGADRLGPGAAPVRPCLRRPSPSPAAAPSGNRVIQFSECRESARALPGLGGVEAAGGGDVPVSRRPHQPDAGVADRRHHLRDAAACGPASGPRRRSTSRTWWLLFSMCQWPRTRDSRRSGPACGGVEARSGRTPSRAAPGRHTSGCA